MTAVGAAATLAPRGIRVNAVRVGTIWSSFAARTCSDTVRQASPEAVLRGTGGPAWDVASETPFLSSPRSAWITGQIVSVNDMQLPGDPAPTPPRGRR